MFEPQIDLTGKLIIKVKLGDDIRRILITNEDITYDELVLMMQRVYRGKLNSTDDIVIKYKDEDSDLITIFDSSDLTFAIQCSRILNITLFVNGKPEPLQTNEVKHIKKELRHIRDTCNRLLDKLDEREPQPTSEAVVDSSTSKVPSQITSIPDNTRKRPSPSTDVQAVSQPNSKEFDPLSTQKAMDVDHQQNKVISSFGLSNDTGGTVERAGTPDSVSSIGSSASNKGRLQPQQPQKPSESPSHSPYQQPGSQSTSQPGTPAHPGSQSVYGGQGPPGGQKIPPWQQQQPQQQQQQSPVQPAQQIGGQYPAQQVPSGSTAGQVSAPGFPPGSQQQGFPPSSQGQPTQAGYGQQQQPSTSQYPGYGQGPQAGSQGQQQMYQPPVQYNPQMGNQPGQPTQQQPQQQPQQPHQYGYGQPSQPSQQPAGPGQGPPAAQGPPGSNPYARGQGTGGYTAGYPRPAGNYPTGYQ